MHDERDAVDQFRQAAATNHEAEAELTMPHDEMLMLTTDCRIEAMKGEERMAVRLPAGTAIVTDDEHAARGLICARIVSIVGPGKD